VVMQEAYSVTQGCWYAICEQHILLLWIVTKTTLPISPYTLISIKILLYSYWNIR